MTATATATAVAEPQPERQQRNRQIPTEVSRALGGGRRKARPSDQRWEVTESDLSMYTLITGRAPTDAERLAALTGVDVHGDPVGRRSRSNGRTTDLTERGWSPSVFYAYLRDFCYQGIHLTMSKPQVATWVRSVSIEARRRLQETQARLTGPRTR